MEDIIMEDTHKEDTSMEGTAMKDSAMENAAIENAATAPQFSALLLLLENLERNIFSTLFVFELGRGEGRQVIESNGLG